MKVKRKIRGMKVRKTVKEYDGLTKIRKNEKYERRRKENKRGRIWGNGGETEDERKKEEDEG